MGACVKCLVDPMTVSPYSCKNCAVKAGSDFTKYVTCVNKVRLGADGNAVGQCTALPPPSYKGGVTLYCNGTAGIDNKYAYCNFAPRRGYTTRNRYTNNQYAAELCATCVLNLGHNSQGCLTCHANSGGDVQVYSNCLSYLTAFKLNAGSAAKCAAVATTDFPGTSKVWCRTITGPGINSTQCSSEAELRSQGVTDPKAQGYTLSSARSSRPDASSQACLGCVYSKSLQQGSDWGCFNCASKSKGDLGRYLACVNTLPLLGDQGAWVAGECTAKPDFKKALACLACTIDVSTTDPATCLKK